MNLAIVAILVYLINMPFGFWREGVRKFSIYWFLAVHLPVPMVVFLRFAFELGFAWHTYPIMIGAFFFGQFTGARIRRARNKRMAVEN